MVVPPEIFRARKFESRDNFRCPTCVRGVKAVHQRLEVGDDSLETVGSFCYLGDVNSCKGGVNWQ